MWEFLQPWLKVLRANVLTSIRPDVYDDPNLRLTVTFQCWLSTESDLKRRSRRKVLLKFLADYPDHSKYQRIREAMELFTMLAAVNNKVFVDLMGNMLTYDSWRTVVYPVWNCFLVGPPSVTNQTFATWETLFMCRKDPWDYSAEFRLAMEKLEKMGLENEETLSRIQNEATWLGIYEGFELWGEQSTAANTNQPKLVVTSQQFARQFGELLRLGVPPAAYLVAVENKTTQGKVSKQCQLLAGRDINTHVSSTNFAFNDRAVVDVTRALCRTDLRKLSLNFSSSQNQRATARANIAYILASLVCRSPLCAPIGAENTFPRIERHGYLPKLSITFDTSTILYGGVCATVADGSSYDELELFANFRAEVEPVTVDHEYWSWLAYAIWSKASHSSVQTLDLRNMGLSHHGLSVFEATLRHGFPIPNMESGSSQSRFLEYGYVHLQAGVEFKPRGFMGDGDISYVLLRDCRCRAQYDSVTAPGVVEAIVPLYGMCIVELNDRRCKFVRDKTEDACDEVIACRRNDVQSLKLNFEQIESQNVLMKLLQHIGNVRSLTLETGNLSRHTNPVARIDLGEVVKACPNVEDLTVAFIHLFVSEYSDLRNWGLKKLAVYDFKDFDTVHVCQSLLDDKQLRTSRNLREMKFAFYGSDFEPDPVTRQIMKQLIAHDGEFLPVTKDKFPIASKAAMISVATSAESLESNTIDRLDASVLSLIFGYAATAQQRSVLKDL